MVENKYLRLNAKIAEVWEVVGTHEIWITGLDKKLKIKVLKIVSSESDNPYMGVSNLKVKGKDCADYYQSLHNQSTKEEALNDAIRGFFAFYSDDADVKEVEDW
jgi:hypothetical protein